MGIRKHIWLSAALVVLALSRGASLAAEPIEFLSSWSPAPHADMTPPLTTDGPPSLQVSSAASALPPAPLTPSVWVPGAWVWDQDRGELIWTRGYWRPVDTLPGVDSDACASSANWTLTFGDFWFGGAAGNVPPALEVRTNLPIAREASFGRPIASRLQSRAALAANAPRPSKTVQQLLTKLNKRKDPKTTAKRAAPASAHSPAATLNAPIPQQTTAAAPATPSSPRPAAPHPWIPRYSDTLPRDPIFRTVEVHQNEVIASHTSESSHAKAPEHPKVKK